jgi:O-acetyl-ADP-ribose deacetylase (regulator of RNase III)
MELSWANSRIRIVRGDITEQDVDAIVNAANPSLMGGGGVDGAIHRKGGPRILAECRRIRQRDWPRGLPTGRAVITSGGRLKARHVIHTVGPVWRGGGEGEPELLAECYRDSLQLAKTKGLGRIAFPSISTGAYGYPIDQAAKVALSTAKKFVESGGGPDEIIFVLFDDRDLATYVETVGEL